MTEVKLDKVRKLKFNARALYEAEKRLGCPVFVVLQDSDRLMSIEVLATFLWAGMLHNGELTFDETIDIIPDNKYVEILGIVMAEVTAAVGTGEEKKNQTGKTGTGK